MPERNHHPATINNPSSKKDGENGPSQFNKSFSSAGRKTVNNTQNNVNGNRSSLENFNKPSGHENEINTTGNLSAPKSVIDKQKRELQSKSATAFGGFSEGKISSEISPGIDGKFVSKNVVREKQNGIEQGNANGNLTNFHAPAIKTPTAELISNVSAKTGKIAQDLGHDLTEIKEKVTETVKEAIFPASFAEEQKRRKKQKAVDKDNKLLNSDRWLVRNGHSLTYAGIFLFTFVLYFRPYEWVPGLSSFTSIAMIFAVATLLIYIPSQLSTEGSLTILTTEVKCILFLAVWALLTLPIAKDPGTVWKTYNDVFIKIVLIFVIMVNTLRSQARLKGLMWLSIGIGVMVSWDAIKLYQEGKFVVEGYRVAVDLGGMFGNPNDMALHLVMFTPLAVVLGIASKNKIAKIMYFVSASLMVAGNMVTQSRGGFLGLVAVAVFLVWKLSKQNRLPIILTSLVIGAIIITAAPGNYWLRILSIFIPGLDGVGSSNQRKELLDLSLLVTARNPLGIGMGNFPIVGIRNLQTHNAYTQVSSELGLLGFAAYIIFIVSPLRKLFAIERQMFSNRDLSWMYYLSIGIQATIIGYMVSSFFDSVAYQWYIYYPIAYAVCLRRIYKLHEEQTGNLPEGESKA